MKNLKLFATKIRRTKLTPSPKLRLFTLIGLSLLIPKDSFGQLNELAQELQKGESDFTKIADIVIRAIKTIAGVSVIVGGLVFLYLREQQNDLTKKVGQVIIGIALFWILLSVGDSMRS